MYCEKLYESLDKRLNERKTIDEIAKELCPGISKGRDKIIRVIKSHRGGRFLLNNFEWLGYHKENIRNHNTGAAVPKAPEERKSPNRLYKPSLATRHPTKKEYDDWIQKLTDICQIIEELDTGFTGTTEGRLIWKLNALAKRTNELRMLLQNR